MNIRKMTINEVNTVFDLIETFDRDKSSRPSEDEVFSILNSLDKLGGGVLVAELNDKVVGTCTIAICPNLSWAGRPYAMIENIIVSNFHQRQGIGTALLKEAEAMAKNANCYKVALMTGLNRDESIKFYESVGFTGNKKGFQRRLNA